MGERSTVLVIGTGFSGLCTAIRLKQEGVEDFVILERAADVGGTWRDNNYPGCACDVQSHLYSFSFEKNPDWSRQFATQPEIWAYLRGCAEKYNILPHVRFNANVVNARFDEASATWVVRTEDGREFKSQLLVSGAGASAIEFVPQIASKVATLDYFQRTPPWAMPKPDWVRTAIREVKPDGVVTTDGKTRKADVWQGQGGPEAYLGLAVSGFPNLFFLMGPNTGLGHSSMVYMIESQVNYVIDAVRTMKAQGLAVVDVRPEVQAQFVKKTQKRLAATVWGSGCKSWYINESGKNTTLWPGFTFRYRAATNRFTPGDYVLKAK
ncbi:MAG: NAD(P)/FAD-dependent oxidoreductase [Aquabacterium sp.]|nr:NAD(P)/FAD-dependent oxidoreductase [Aquabacterium sp.]